MVASLNPYKNGLAVLGKCIDLGASFCGTKIAARDIVVPLYTYLEDGDEWDKRNVVGRMRVASSGQYTQASAMNGGH